MSSEQEFRIEGLDKLVRKLKSIGKDMPVEMERIAKKSALLVKSKLPEYPTQGLTYYARQGTLGRQIVAESSKRGLTEYEGIIGSNTSYAPWVISDEEGKNAKGPQAWFHKGVWWTLQGEVKKAKSSVIALYDRELKSLLRKAK